MPIHARRLQGVEERVVVARAGDQQPLARLHLARAVVCTLLLFLLRCMKRCALSMGVYATPIIDLLNEKLTSFSRLASSSPAGLGCCGGGGVVVGVAGARAVAAEETAKVAEAGPFFCFFLGGGVGSAGAEAAEAAEGKAGDAAGSRRAASVGSELSPFGCDDGVTSAAGFFLLFFRTLVDMSAAWGAVCKGGESLGCG